MKQILGFLKDDSGAVTVDWVVLTAAVVGLGLVVFTFVRPSVSNLAYEIAHMIEHAKGCLASQSKTCH